MSPPFKWFSFDMSLSDCRAKGVFFSQLPVGSDPDERPHLIFLLQPLIDSIVFSINTDDELYILDVSERNRSNKTWQ